MGGKVMLIKNISITCLALLISNNVYCMNNSFNESSSDFNILSSQSSNFNILSESFSDFSAPQPIENDIINDNQLQNIIEDNKQLKEQNIKLQKEIEHYKKQLAEANKNKVQKKQQNRVNENKISQNQLNNIGIPVERMMVPVVVAAGLKEIAQLFSRMRK